MDILRRLVPPGSAEGKDDAAVIDRFVRESDPDTVRGAHAELTKLLSLGLDEAEMQSAVWYGFGCGYTPLDDGVTMINWVTSVRDRLAGVDA